MPRWLNAWRSKGGVQHSSFGRMNQWSELFQSWQAAHESGHHRCPGLRGRCKTIEAASVGMADVFAGQDYVLLARYSGSWRFSPSFRGADREWSDLVDDARGVSIVFAREFLRRPTLGNTTGGLPERGEAKEWRIARDR